MGSAGVVTVLVSVLTAMRGGKAHRREDALRRPGLGIAQGERSAVAGCLCTRKASRLRDTAALQDPEVAEAGIADTLIGLAAIPVV